MIEVVILINGKVRKTLRAVRVQPMVTKAHPEIAPETICHYEMRRGPMADPVNFLHRYGDGPEVLARIMIEQDLRAGAAPMVPA